MNGYFSKSLIITEEEKEEFQSRNTCWICKKLIEDRKVRDH